MVTVKFRRKKKGEVVSQKEFYIGIPRYEKSIKWALGADVVFAGLCLYNAYDCVKLDKPVLAVLTTFTAIMYFMARGTEVGGLLEQKKAGAAE